MAQQFIRPPGGAPPDEDEEAIQDIVFPAPIPVFEEPPMFNPLFPQFLQQPQFGIQLGVNPHGFGQGLGLGLDLAPLFIPEPNPVDWDALNQPFQFEGADELDDDLEEGIDDLPEGAGEGDEDQLVPFVDGEDEFDDMAEGGGLLPFDLTNPGGEPE